MKQIWSPLDKHGLTIELETGQDYASLAQREEDDYKSMARVVAQIQLEIDRIRLNTGEWYSYEAMELFYRIKEIRQANEAMWPQTGIWSSLKKIISGEYLVALGPSPHSRHYEIKSTAVAAIFCEQQKANQMGFLLKSLTDQLCDYDFWGRLTEVALERSGAAENGEVIELLIEYLVEEQRFVVRPRLAHVHAYRDHPRAGQKLFTYHFQTDQLDTEILTSDRKSGTEFDGSASTFYMAIGGGERR